MSEPVKIASLELENVKRVRAVSLEPTRDGLTVIGGRNAQGKTSVLDAIAWALGGNKRKPKRANREGSSLPAHLRVELSNGLVAERKGKNGALTVTDPSGGKAGQALLDSFIEEFALDLPKFMALNDSGKAEVLLRIVGIGDELKLLDSEVDAAFNERTAVGQQERAKRKVAEEMPYYSDVPSEPVSASELIEQQQEILAKNGENQRKRLEVDRIGRQLDEENKRVEQLKSRMAELKTSLAAAEARALKLSDDWMTASKTAEQLKDESTAEIEKALADIDAVNEKVRANQRRFDMQADAERLTDERRALDERIERLRSKRTQLLNGVEMPLPELSVDNGKLVYKGSVWSDMSSAEQLMVSTAIVRSLKPECGFVLVDELEKMDPVTLADFGAWAEEQGLQVIGTRVAVDESCTIVIEDGRVVGAELKQAAQDAPDEAAETASQPTLKKPEPEAPQRPMLIPGAF